MKDGGGAERSGAGRPALFSEKQLCNGEETPGVAWQVQAAMFCSAKWDQSRVKAEV